MRSGLLDLALVDAQLAGQLPERHLAEDLVVLSHALDLLVAGRPVTALGQG